MTEAELEQEKTEVMENIDLNHLKIIMSTVKKSDSLGFIKSKLLELDKFSFKDPKKQHKLQEARKTLKERIQNIENKEYESAGQGGNEPPFPPELRGEDLNSLQIELFRVLKSNGPCDRKTLVNILNKPRTTIYDNLKKLQQKSLITKYTRNNNKRGRPRSFWKLHPALQGGATLNKWWKTCFTCPFHRENYHGRGHGSEWCAHSDKTIKREHRYPNNCEAFEPCELWQPKSDAQKYKKEIQIDDGGPL